MRVLVAGGAGFIGSHFVDLLIQKPAVKSVVVVDALTYAGNLKNLSESMSEIEFHEADIRDMQAMEKLVQKTDVIVNFAAETHNDNSLDDHKPFLETNIMGTANLLDLAARYDIRFHQVSTDEVFGDFEKDSTEEWDENSPYNPSSPYSASKAAADHLVNAWHRSHGVFSTISICSNNYGPRQHAEKLIPNTIKTLAAGKKAPVYGDGKNIREWIHVKDHVEGIWAVIEKGQAASTYLFGSRDRLSNIDLVRSITYQMGRGDESIEFVEDRKGHDRRYALNPDRTIGRSHRPSGGRRV
jgi:dTDP-glucose 4,6-dehydratase